MDSPELLRHLPAISIHACRCVLESRGLKRSHSYLRGLIIFSRVPPWRAIIGMLIVCRERLYSGRSAIVEQRRRGIEAIREIARLAAFLGIRGERSGETIAAG